MIAIRHAGLPAFIVAAALLGGCGEQAEAPATTETVDVPYEDTLRLALETAQPGDVIEIPEGNHSFSRGLTLNTDGVTIRGAGMDKSMLNVLRASDRRGRRSAGECQRLHHRGSSAIEDTVGDALKVNEGSEHRRSAACARSGPGALHTENGAYGIYPVQTENRSSSRAPSRSARPTPASTSVNLVDVIVRDSRAEYNVAGIEIENTVRADVYDNVATNNTGGILVFNMPDLPQEGHSTRVFNNQDHQQQYRQLRPAGRCRRRRARRHPGSSVNSNDRVEDIRATRSANNRTANVLISSFFSASYSDRETAPHFDPYPRDHLHLRQRVQQAPVTAPDRAELEAASSGHVRQRTGQLPGHRVGRHQQSRERRSSEFAICVNNGDVGGDQRRCGQRVRERDRRHGRAQPATTRSSRRSCSRSAACRRRRLTLAWRCSADIASVCSALGLACRFSADGDRLRQPARPPVAFFQAPDAYPENGSPSGVVVRPGRGTAPARTDRVSSPYDLNAPLFTDYAQKLRAIYLPPGTSATYHEYGSLRLSGRHHHRQNVLLSRKPRLSRRWCKASYTWSDRADRASIALEVQTCWKRGSSCVRQTAGMPCPTSGSGEDAVLHHCRNVSNGWTIDLDDGRRRAPLPYIVPTRNECAACHATDHSSGDLQPIGPRARHLNRGYLGGADNQLIQMAASGRLQGLPDSSEVPANADPDGSGSLAARARSYLDINCGHCHNPQGAADTSGLHLDAATTNTRALGICKPPIAAGQGTGGRSYSIVPGDADDSIIVFRMVTSDPGARMPELGRSLHHQEGIALVSSWIDGLDGRCIEREGASLTGD